MIILIVFIIGMLSICYLTYKFGCWIGKHVNFTESETTTTPVTTTQPEPDPVFNN